MYDLDQEKHNLLIEIQVLIAILGAIAAYGAVQAPESNFIMISVVLAAPLIFSVIVLMMGPPKESIKIIEHLDLVEVLDTLRKGQIIRNKYLSRTKKMIAIGSLLSIELVIISILNVKAVYQIMWFPLAVFATIMFLVFDLALVAIVFYQTFSKVNFE